jgi:hypothetical protein
MVKIMISAAAFAAIAATLPLGTVAVEAERAPDGSVGLGESYSEGGSRAGDRREVLTRLAGDTTFSGVIRRHHGSN